MQKQKFVFTEGNRIEEIAEFLLRSTHIHVLNLEFYDLCISALPSSVWKKCGHQIHTLYFKRCEFRFTVHVNVALYCVNLTSLEMIDMEDCTDGCGERDESDANSPSNLSDLVQVVRHMKLRTFVWFDEVFPLPTTAVEQYFLVFPCLTRFANGLEPSYNYQLPAADEKDESMYANFDECFDSSMPLERIVYNTATDGSWMTRSILKPEWSSRFVMLYNYFVVVLTPRAKYQRCLVTRPARFQVDRIANNVELQKPT